MSKITISTGHPDAGRVFAKAFYAALDRETALREELDLLKPTLETTFDAAQRDRAERDAIQQRLTVADQQIGTLSAFAQQIARQQGDPYFSKLARTALKKAEEGELA